ncbi:hypothetical protein MMC28_003131 [Mycoblastus sanguinarius]|nr:hypothetical protein [Mycoblastus sanguinarius]
MAMRGQRFHIDLGSEDETDNVKYSGLTGGAGLSLGLVGDIKERTASSAPNFPLPSRPKSFETGFPAHKIRTGHSRFKKSRETQPSKANQRATSNGASSQTLDQNRTNGNMSSKPTLKKDAVNGMEDQGIDEENKQRLAQMSAEEIDEARRELMAGLSPSLIEKLLKKANIDEGRADSHAGLEQSDAEDAFPLKKPTKQVTFEEPEPSSPPALPMQGALTASDPDAPPSQPPPDLHPASSDQSLPPPPNIHFPKPPPAPDLDPSDPNFLSTLHSTYFPSLPSDPSTLAWMTPIDSRAENESAYSPSQSSLPPSSLRFDFRAHLLPPRLSSQIPSTKGLHHHAHAPASAGYTIPELAHLARSAYPAQRCIAYQTLGRVLYRLGRGDFGQEGDDLCEGLWELVEQGRVIEGLVDAAGKGEEGGNRSVWVTATEAVWLWRKGGGRRWKGR